jgi:hypothetical protein
VIGFLIPEGADLFLRHHIQRESGAHVTSSTISDGALTQGLKWPGLETDHSPITGTEDSELTELPLHFSIRLHGAVLNKAKNPKTNLILKKSPDFQKYAVRI